MFCTNGENNQLLVFIFIAPTSSFFLYNFQTHYLKNLESVAKVKTE